MRESIPMNSRSFAENNYLHEISPCTEVKNKSIVYNIESTNSKIKSKGINENTIKIEKELIKNIGEIYNLCVISVEIFSDVRENFVFDFEKDAINV